MLVYSSEDGDGGLVGGMVYTSMEMSMSPSTWKPVRWSSDQCGDSVRVERPGGPVQSLPDSTVVPGDAHALSHSVGAKWSFQEAHFFPDSAKLKQHSQCKE